MSPDNAISPVEADDLKLGETLLHEIQTSGSPDDERAALRALDLMTLLEGEPLQAGISGQGKYAFTKSESRELRLYDTDTCTEIHSVTGVDFALIDPRGRYIAVLDLSDRRAQQMKLISLSDLSHPFSETSPVPLPQSPLYDTMPSSGGGYFLLSFKGKGAFKRQENRIFEVTVDDNGRASVRQINTTRRIKVGGRPARYRSSDNPDLAFSVSNEELRASPEGPLAEPFSFDRNSSFAYALPGDVSLFSRETRKAVETRYGVLGIESEKEGFGYIIAPLKDISPWHHSYRPSRIDVFSLKTGAEAGVIEVGPFTELPRILPGGILHVVEDKGEESAPEERSFDLHDGCREVDTLRAVAAQSARMGQHAVDGGGLFILHAPGHKAVLFDCDSIRKNPRLAELVLGKDEIGGVRAVLDHIARNTSAA